jgi:hypothetical protein
MEKKFLHFSTNKTRKTFKKQQMVKNLCFPKNF